MLEGFRIKAVTIEGFKGFMKQKEIDLDGNHVQIMVSDSSYSATSEESRYAHRSTVQIKIARENHPVG